MTGNGRIYQLLSINCEPKTSSVAQNLGIENEIQEVWTGTKNLQINICFWQKSSIAWKRKERIENEQYFFSVFTLPLDPPLEFA